GDNQGNQHQQPHQAGVLDKGLGAGGDLADQGAGGGLQGHGVATQGAEQAEGHHQGNQHLHGGHPEVAEAGVDAEGQALLLAGIEETDIGHGGGKIAAAKARQQGQQLVDPQGCIRVLQGDSRPQGRDHQQRGGEHNGVPAATQANEEAAGNTQGGAG